MSLATILLNVLSLAISQIISALAALSAGTARVQIITALCNGSPLATPCVKAALLDGRALETHPASPLDIAMLTPATDDNAINFLLSMVPDFPKRVSNISMPRLYFGNNARFQHYRVSAPKNTVASKHNFLDALMFTNTHLDMLTLIFIQGLYDMKVSLFYQCFALLKQRLSIHCEKILSRQSYQLALNETGMINTYRQ